MASSFLDLYDPLDIIGNGSFGIIRKVRRKSDGLTFARKELNFERMSERDRKQIVAEVNILKDLHHDHIVRYHDRYVDRDAGILYILMEYCGGGDLSSVIKQAAKHTRPIPEETIWNYFMQILLALHHCHHPNGHARSGSGTSGGGGMESDSGERRTQVLHRDLKPDNVFLDETNSVKLGDFGLSKALAQASFANTYVGTPYYMSPELMQEKAYDSKSDIWSLGCLIYELCALKPPFHEAKTHSELSICIRNGRIPPLPRGYSTALSGVIKAMLNLNPAMRPSAAQLLQHERLELVFKVAETEKMLSVVKTHKSTVLNREREVLAREAALREKEQQLTSAMSSKDNEIASLRQTVAQLEQQQRQQQYLQRNAEMAIKEAVARREEELRTLVMRREAEVAEAMAGREQEIMEAVRKREAEVFEEWRTRETNMQREIEEKITVIQDRVDWIQAREEELAAEDARLETVRAGLEEKVAKWEESAAKGRKEKSPLEEVKNLLEPLARLAQDTPSRVRAMPPPKPSSTLHPFPPVATPVTRPAKPDYMPSAMKGVVLTTTGEVLATPTPAALANLFNNSPKVGLNFAKIFDFGDADDDDDDTRNDTPTGAPALDENCSPPPSPSSRKKREKVNRLRNTGSVRSDPGSSKSTSTSSVAAPPTRLRRPSIRTSSSRSALNKTPSLPSSISDPTGLSGTSPSCSTSHVQPKPLPHPHLPSTTTRAVTLPIPQSHPSPKYDLADEENLPSPFLKRTIDCKSVKGFTSVRGAKKRPGSGHSLRAVAAANAAGRRSAATSALSSPTTGEMSKASGTPGIGINARPSVTSARKAGEEARKALSRS